MSLDLSGDYPLTFDFEKRLLHTFQKNLQEEKDEEIPSLYKGSTEFCRRLGRELVNSREPSRYESLCDQKLIDRMFTFNQREQFFLEGWNRWISNFTEEELDSYYNPVNLFYWFSSVYVQQIEGPFRYNLAAVYDMIMSISGSDTSWHELLYNERGKAKYHNITNSIKQIEERYLDADRGSNFKAAIWMLDGGRIHHDGELYQMEINIRDIRNSIAHSDYVVQQNSDGKIFVEFDHGESYTKIYIEKFLNYIHRHMVLMHGISIGVSSSLAWIARELDKNSYVHDISNSFQMIDIRE